MVSLPHWTDASGALLDPGLFDRARKIVALYRGAGCGNPFAFGMLGCAEGENNDLDPNGKGDWYAPDPGSPGGAMKRLPWSERYPPGAAPTSFGLSMRKEDRTKAIRDGVGKLAGLGFDIRALVLVGQNTIENEVRATLWELTNFPVGYGGPAIRAAGTAYGAAYRATVTFERAGTVANGEAERRGAMAETWTMLASGIWSPLRGPTPADLPSLAEGWA